MKGGFTLLWAKILDSSIWRLGSKETRLVWLTMLAMRDEDGFVSSSIVGLADRARVSVEECKMALEIFLAPDPEDTSGVEEGRKIRKVQGGWQLINHDLYRFSTEAKREFWRQQKAEQRAREAEAKKLKEEKKISKKKLKAHPGPLTGEDEYCRILKEQGQEAADAWLKAFQESEEKRRKQEREEGDSATGL